MAAAASWLFIQSLLCGFCQICLRGSVSNVRCPHRPEPLSRVEACSRKRVKQSYHQSPVKPIHYTKMEGVEEKGTEGYITRV